MNQEKLEHADAETTAEKGKKSRHGCLKGCLVGMVVSLLLTAGTVFAGWKYLEQQLGSGGTIQSTTITVLSGTAQKRVSGKWVNLATGERLAQSDQVKTLSKSLATIQLPNGSEFRLDEQTEVSLNDIQPDNVSIVQNAGRTWSRVENLLGKKQTFEVETPTAVATVRGTAFSTTVTDRGTTVDVAVNAVEVSAIERVGKERKQLDKLSVDSGFTTSVGKRDLAELKAGGKRLSKVAMTREMEDSPWFRDNRGRDDELLKRLREHPGGLKGKLRELMAFAQVDVADWVKIKGLVERARSGNMKLTAGQQARVEALVSGVSPEMSDDDVASRIAQALAIVDPENFSDVSHWTGVAKKLMPLIRKGQFMMDDLPTSESSGPR